MVNHLLKKKALLKKRKEGKEDAEKEFNSLKEQLTSKDNDLNEDDKQDIISAMDELKRQFIYLKKDQIKTVKELITAYGAVYYDALGEADVLCAELVITGKAWACMSEDMDLFVYGATRILRYFSLLNHNVVVYDLEKILEELGISQKELREICVLSGNDYNENVNDDNNLFKVLKMFKKYHKGKKNEKKNEKKNGYSFYNWILDNKPNYIQDYDKLMKIIEMFAEPKSKKIDNIEIVEKSIDKQKMWEILEEDGFLCSSFLKSTQNQLSK